jgi:hypothetical protein
MRYKVFDFVDEYGLQGYVTLRPSWNRSPVIVYDGLPVDTEKTRFKYDKVNDVYLRVKLEPKTSQVLVIPETSKYFNFDFIQHISPIRQLIRFHQGPASWKLKLQSIERELKTIGNNLIYQ